MPDATRQGRRDQERAVVTCRSCCAPVSGTVQAGGRNSEAPWQGELLHPHVSCVLLSLANLPPFLPAPFTALIFLSSLQFIFLLMGCQVQRWDLALLCTEINGISSACLQCNFDQQWCLLLFRKPCKQGGTLMLQIPASIWDPTFYFLPPIFSWPKKSALTT